MVCVAEMVVSVAVDIEVVQRRVALVVFPDGDAEQTGDGGTPLSLLVLTGPNSTTEIRRAYSFSFAHLLTVASDQSQQSTIAREVFGCVPGSKVSGNYLDHRC
jgi:hypothetical protein